MRFAGSLMHLLSGGLVLSLGWLAAAICYAPFSATRPIAGLCWRLAILNLHPFGQEPVRDRQVRNFQDYLRTGHVPDAGRPVFGPRGDTLLQAVLWFPAGLVLVGGHILHGLLTSMLAFSNPWRSRSFALLGPALFPVGWRVAPVSPARARLAGHPRSPPRRASIAPRTRGPLPIRRIAGSTAATVGGAVLVFWASYSATGPLIVPAAAPIGFQGAMDLAGIPGAQHDMPSDLYRMRPEANPPLPLGRAPAAAEQPAACGAPAGHVADFRLARRHRDFSLPLGAGQIRRLPGPMPFGSLARMQRVQAFAVSLRYAKVARPPCRRGDLADKAVRSASFAARKAETARLASKAAPDIILASLGPSPMVGEPRRRHKVEMRSMANIGRMAALMSPAKAANPPDAASAAARIARTASLRSPPPSPADRL